MGPPESNDRHGAEATEGLSGVSVVVPVYHSTTTLPELVERLDAALADRDHEVILVDDGSPPATWGVVQGLAMRYPHVAGVRLNRNFGQHNALLAGVRRASRPIVVTMDDDLQHPPEEVPRLVAALTDELDVVYGYGGVVAQNLWRRVSSTVTRRIIGSVLGGENASRLTAFRVFRTNLRQAFGADLGPAVSIDALLSWATSRFGHVEVEHHPRAEGESAYTLRALARHALDVSTGYSAIPLQIATGLGVATAIFGFLVLVWVVGRTVLTGTSVPGFPFLASTISIFAGAQLITLGIIGEYLARMHFRIMRKPTYVVGDEVGLARGEVAVATSPETADRSLTDWGRS